MSTKQTNQSIKGVVIALIALFFIAPNASHAQKDQENETDKISLASVKPIEVIDGSAFNLHFETADENLMGIAKTSVEGYDSLALSSFELSAKEDKNFIKISGYLVNTSTQNQLKWTSAVNYTRSSKELAMLGGTYIQFAAYYKLEHAQEGLKFFEGFDIDIIKVGDMYKLVTPYDKEEFRKAKETFADYNIWSVKYEGTQVALVN